MSSKNINKVVLAYSGGLDTSVILTWLRDTYDCEVVTFIHRPWLLWAIHSSVFHGTRIVFDSDNKLYFAIGDRGQQNNAQDSTNHYGSVMRINDDGTVNYSADFKSNDGSPKRIRVRAYPYMAGLSTKFEFAKTSWL